MILAQISYHCSCWDQRFPCVVPLMTASAELRKLGGTSRQHVRHRTMHRKGLFDVTDHDLLHNRTLIALYLFNEFCSPYYQRSIIKYLLHHSLFHLLLLNPYFRSVSKYYFRTQSLLDESNTLSRLAESA